jgi:hypothetical protein
VHQRSIQDHRHDYGAPVRSPHAALWRAPDLVAPDDLDRRPVSMARARAGGYPGCRAGYADRVASYRPATRRGRTSTTPKRLAGQRAGYERLAELRTEWTGSACSTYAARRHRDQVSRARAGCGVRWTAGAPSGAGDTIEQGEKHVAEEPRDDTAKAGGGPSPAARHRRPADFVALGSAVLCRAAGTYRVEPDVAGRVGPDMRARRPGRRVPAVAASRRRVMTEQPRFGLALHGSSALHR